MPNAILEPTIIESSALAEASIPEAPTKAAKAAPLIAAPDTGNGRMNPNGLSKRESTKSIAIQGRRRGPLGRSFRALRDASFQIGLSAPGKRWYRESKDLNAKDKAVLDAAMHGFL